ncbi:MAG: hypothetical protein H6587_05715 [Flavobacteriales bacterium]|nr:hypothetical protein [Flavobacteriales bacterium]MCB9364048.1 hypothetical protein [Flavobacteriales bacterium]
MKTYLIITSCLILGLSSCSKEEGEGGRSSISGTLEGVVIDSERTEVTEVTCVTQDDIKKGDYWFLNSPSSHDDYFIWYNNINSPSSAPLITSRIAVKVDYSSLAGDNNITIATKTEDALNAIIDLPFTIVRSNDKLTITNNFSGEVTDSDNGISKMVVDVKTQGRNQIVLQSGAIANEDVFIIYGDNDDIQDDDVKSNFDGTFKFKNLRQGSYRIFAYSEDPSLANPLTPIIKSIDIGKNEDADIGTISIEIKDN